MIKNLPFLLSGIIISIILYQSVLIAPAINELININDASVFLRFIWPKFFVLISLLSLFSLIVIIYNKDSNSKKKYFVVTSFLTMLFCLSAVPFINEAKDIDNEFLWSILHLITVILTLVTLIINILIMTKWDFINKVE